MKKVVLFFLFFYVNFLFAQTVDFSFEKPKISISNNFSYNIVNDISSSRFFDSALLSVDAKLLKVDCGVQGSSENISFSFDILCGPNILNFFDVKGLFLYNGVDDDCFFEINIVCGLDVGVKFSPFFNFETKVAYLFKASNIKSSNLVFTDSSIELAFYFDWFVANKINPFFYIETASFFKHYILPTAIFSTGVNYEILEKIEIGCSVSATYINFITVVPYHSEVSVSSYVKFIVM